jgi:hypothetical protein
MFEDISPDLKLAANVSPCEWILSSLQPWGRDGLRLWSFMPEGFEAYARVFHPLLFGKRNSDDVQRSWASVAAERGLTLSPDISLYEVLGAEQFTETGQYVRPEGHPADGELPAAVCEGLVRTLTPHTTTPETCWFGVWVGVLGAGVPLRSGGGTRRERREDQARVDEVQARLDALPKLDCGEGREHVLFKGPIDAACSIHPHGWVTPALWWPDDRAWTVVTEIDGVCTFVGGSRSAIDDVLASDLESIEVTLEVHIS